jgi:hypothetical protein
VQEKQTIRQCKKNELYMYQWRKNKLSTGAGKTNYMPVEENQIIQQRKKNKLSTSTGKIQYPPVHKNKIFLYKKHFELSIIAK